MKINDIVFTNHAVDRMKERGIKGQWAWETVKNASVQKPGREKHTTEFMKEFGIHTVSAVGKKNDIGEWVILSVWMNPPLKGTRDFFNKQSYIAKLNKSRIFSQRIAKASFWGKMWLTFRKQVGL